MTRQYRRAEKVPFTDPPRQRCGIPHENISIEGVRILFLLFSPHSYTGCKWHNRGKEKPLYG